MKMVMKGNKQLRVPDERVDAMLEQGFAEVDPKSGKVIRERKQDEVTELKKQIKDLEKTNKKLEAELKKADKEVEALKAELEALKKAEQ